MDLTRFAIANNRVTAVLLLTVLLAGYSAYLTMEQAMDPGFTIRTARIVTRFPGAGPDRVEELVTDKIETAIQELPELDFVTSTSKTGLSIVSANIRTEFTAMRPIWDNLRRKVAEAARSLPEGARESLNKVVLARWLVEVVRKERLQPGCRRILRLNPADFDCATPIFDPAATASTPLLRLGAGMDARLLYCGAQAVA